MKRAFAALLTLALVLFLVPAAGAISESSPHASTWEQTDIMGAFVPLGEPRGHCVQDSWLLSHDTFFRGGTLDVVPEDPFENAGEFTAIENGTTTHTGEIWWVATGMVKLIGLGPDPSCETADFPVDGEFRGKGAMKITHTDDVLLETPITCSLRFTTHLIGDPGDLLSDPPVFPEVTWSGNFVAHCDDGSKIHLDVIGPRPPSDPQTPEPRGFVQDSSGIILR